KTGHARVARTTGLRPRSGGASARCDSRISPAFRGDRRRSRDHGRVLWGSVAPSRASASSRPQLLALAADRIKLRVSPRAAACSGNASLPFPSLPMGRRRMSKSGATGLALIFVAGASLALGACMTPIEPDTDYEVEL